MPQSLVRELEGNDSMRSKFEALCRKAQNDICERIEELDGEGKVSSLHFSTLHFSSLQRKTTRGDETRQGNTEKREKRLEWNIPYITVYRWNGTYRI